MGLVANLLSGMLWQWEVHGAGGKARAGLYMPVEVLLLTEQVGFPPASRGAGKSRNRERV